MKELRFKTNINCQNCVRAVTGFIEEVENVEHWSVDTDNADKVLSVKGPENLNVDLLIEAVEEAGFDIEQI